MFNLRFMVCAVALAIAGVAFSQETIAQIRAREALSCGVNGALPGFGAVDASGGFRGFDVDFCRALASAVLGNREAVQFVPLNSQQRFEALRSGQIDVLIRNTTWTSSRDTQLELNFTLPIFYDGQGVMVHRDAGIRSLEDFANRTICIDQGTTTELNFADQLKVRGIPYNALIFGGNELALSAFVNRLCDAFTTDKSGLAAYIATMPNPQSYLILDEGISKEPLGPSVRHGDDQWFKVVQWVIFGLIQAEEYGITSENVAEVAATTNHSGMRRLLGLDDNVWEAFNLDATVMQRVIADMGNYGEIYERNLGTDTATYIPRGLNNLWTNGGLLYAPPFTAR